MSGPALTEHWALEVLVFNTKRKPTMAQSHKGFRVFTLCSLKLELHFFKSKKFPLNGWRDSMVSFVVTFGWDYRENEQIDCIEY